ncbi:MAG: hypothetical protein JOS17DRAFT_789331 [Linnemannia elongata]|nr:MAG: hypothetical protein JOS17DRAFT_789331 [Linnemannia elongata]
MSVNVGSYCDSTITKRVTLESFMKHVNFLNDKEKILRLWIGRVVPYLLSHHTNSKRQVGARLKTLESHQIYAVQSRMTAASFRRLEYSAHGVGCGVRPQTCNIEEGDDSASDDEFKHQDELINKKPKKRSRVVLLFSSFGRRSQGSYTNETTTDWQVDVACFDTKLKYDKGRQSSFSSGGGVFVTKPYVDAASFKVYKYKIEDCTSDYALTSSKQVRPALSTTSTSA